MTNDPIEHALRQLSASSDVARPLSSDAQDRIEARLDTAFSEASTHAEFDVSDDVDQFRGTPDENESQHRPRRRIWRAPMAAAAAVIMLVIGLALIRAEDPAPPSADIPGLSPIDFPTDLLRSGTRWRLGTDLIGSESGAANASVTIRMTDEVRAQARVATAEVPNRQFLGEVRFALGPTGRVLVPVLLLDPERVWIDCDATIDLGASGTATCAGDEVDYTVVAGDDDDVDTPLGRYQARVFVVDWSVDGGRTTALTRLWISADVGPVRIDVDDRVTATTYTLQALDTPGPSPTNTLTGD